VLTHVGIKDRIIGKAALSQTNLLLLLFILSSMLLLLLLYCQHTVSSLSSFLTGEGANANANTDLASIVVVTAASVISKGRCSRHGASMRMMIRTNDFKMPSKDCRCDLNLQAGAVLSTIMVK
jgi:hypothetical protein